MLFIRTIKNLNNIIFPNTILLFSLPSDFCTDPSLMSTWTNVKVDLKILHVSSDSKICFGKIKRDGWGSGWVGGQTNFSNASILGTFGRATPPLWT